MGLLIFPLLGWRCEPPTLTPEYSALGSLRLGRDSQSGCSVVQRSRAAAARPSGPLSPATEETSGNSKVGKEEVNLRNIPFPRVNEELILKELLSHLFNPGQHLKPLTACSSCLLGESPRSSATPSEPQPRLDIELEKLTPSLTTLLSHS